MLRSMYSGISGMRVNQTKLDVAGNNIANVGTTGFKGSRVRFQDMLSQNVAEALGPGRNQGGVNARQVGLGVQVAGIDTITTQGMMQPTSRNLDVAVDGTGYFVVAKGELPATNAEGITVDPAGHTMSGGNLEINYTRDGAFVLDKSGNLLTSDGYRIMGYSLKEQTGPNSSSLSIDYDQNGAVNFVDSDSKDGLITTGTLVPLRIPDSVHVNPTTIGNASSTPVGIPEDMNYTGSGVKLKMDGTNDLVNTTVDTNGFKFVGNNDVQVQVKWAKDPADNTDKWMIYVNGEAKVEADGTNAIYVDTSGNILTTQPTTVEGIDFTTINVSAPDTNIPPGSENKYSWSFTLNAEKDKKIRSFSIEKDGIIKAVLDDGSVSALGQIAMTSFKNPEGLKKLGKNLYQNTANSGEPIVRSGVNDPKDMDNSDGYGDMLQGMLEMSNVDLAEQFTDMIVTTRAFQAAGKMITTGDEILQDIINLKR